VSYVRAEKDFYEAVKEKVTLTYNKYLREGDIMNSYVQVLVLLLRLRQACTHPALITKKLDADIMEKNIGVSGSEKDAMDELADAFGSMGVDGSATLHI